MNLPLSFCVAQNATTHSGNTAKHCAFRGKILAIAAKLREKGLSESYLATLIRALNEIGNNTNLSSPSEVLTYIAQKKVKDSYKANLCDFYEHYARQYCISFCKPKYHRRHRVPNLPTKENINIIISHATKKYAFF